MVLEEQRKKVISIAQKARESGLVALTFGNFSLRDRETGYVCITPSGLDYRELVPGDIVVVDLERNVIQGSRKPSAETPMHLAVYRKRPDVFGICHTHSPYATAWASCKTVLPVLVAELAALVGEEVVKTAPYRPMGTVELGEIAAGSLGDRYAVLLANHGLLAVGPDLEAAYANAVVVEEGARIAYLVRNIGEARLLSPDECRSLKQWADEKYGQK
ncbi:MAG: class II aldolase/adducin family protein [Peptococcaceae bacterium]|nr:class II aldolase/adducin family protein [Peptococcaceae bacterium]MDH7525089.1 class II aldolase/adducin family protein [Peptococcaceae bacterium]